MPDKPPPPEPVFRRGLYKGAAADYDRYRLPYPAELGAWIADELGLDGSGSLLDLGAGTGHVSRLLRPYFARVVAVEAEPGMVDHGNARSERDGEGIEWRLGLVEEVDFAPGTFNVVAAGNAFHRFDRPVVVAKVTSWLEPEGAVVLLSGGGTRFEDAEWQRTLDGVVAEWTQRTGAAARVPAGWERTDYPDEAVLRDGGFGRVYERSMRVELRRTADDIVGWFRSTSFASRDAMGEHADAFEAAVRGALLELDERGVYPHVAEFAAMIARR